MTNQFEDRPDVLVNGQPVLEFYDIKDTKWASLGYEALFFLGFFFFAWLVRWPARTSCPSAFLSMSVHPIACTVG
jgi:hypothetical protein